MQGKELVVPYWQLNRYLQVKRKEMRPITLICPVASLKDLNTPGIGKRVQAQVDRLGQGRIITRMLADVVFLNSFQESLHSIGFLSPEPLQERRSPLVLRHQLPMRLILS